MSMKRIHQLGLPKHLIEKLTEECRIKKITPTELIIQALTKRFPVQSSEDKLGLLRDLIRRKYALWE